MDKLPTIKEIANRLNVSISTVSRALHDHPSIGLRTKQRVREIADELRYEPNIAAIQFKKGKTFIVGVILPELSENFFSEAISGIEDTAAAQGYNVIFGQSHNDLEKEKSIVSLFKKSRVDGILVSISKNTKNIDHFKELERYNIPIVYFDRIPKSEKVNSISCNLYNTSIDIIDFLWKKGHRHIALIKGPQNLQASNERMRGVLDGLNKKRVKTDASLFGISDLSREGTWRAMKDILSQKNRPTAIIAFNDYVALDGMQYINECTDLVINKDICFVSYANIPMRQYMTEGPIASVEQFPYAQGKMAAEKLLELLNMPVEQRDKVKVENLIIEGKLIELETKKKFIPEMV